MEHVYTIKDLRDLLTPVFSRYGIQKAILFGSYARQKATEASDIDILVDSRLHGLRFVGFIEEVRQALGKEVDIFDVSHIEKESKIDHEIRGSGVVVYEK